MVLCRRLNRRKKIGARGLVACTLWVEDVKFTLASLKKVNGAVTVLAVMGMQRTPNQWHSVFAIPMSPANGPVLLDTHSSQLGPLA